MVLDKKWGWDLSPIIHLKAKHFALPVQFKIHPVPLVIYVRSMMSAGLIILDAHIKSSLTAY